MQLINNKRSKAGDFITEHIMDAAHLSVISAFFSIYAFEMLEAKLPFIKQLRLFFSAPIALQDNLALIGDVDERKLRNRLTQQFVARQCKEWLAANSEIRQATAKNIIQQNIFCTETAALQGSADLTAAGLGFVASMRHDLCTAFEEPENIQELAEWFEAVWGDSRYNPEAGGLRRKVRADDLKEVTICR